MTAATCRKVQGGIARDGADGALAEVTSRHLRACAACRAHDRARARVRDGVLAADDNLDDLTRARVLARLLEGQRHRSTNAATALLSGGRAWLGWTLAFSAVMVLGVAGVLHSRKPGAVAPSLTPFALEPYAVHGGPTPVAPSLSSGGLDRVELPAHASMRARLGPSVDFVLVGPLELAVRDADDKRAAVELRRGTLVGDFDGSSGHSLRIVTADATVDIVGTRFLVEASADHTRVSVEHGRVRVASHGQVRLVGARQEWSTDRAELEPLGAARAALFEGAARGKLEDLAPDASASPAASALPAPSRHAAPIVADAPRPRAAARARATLALADPRREMPKRHPSEPAVERAPDLSLPAQPAKSPEPAVITPTSVAVPRAPETAPAPPSSDAKPKETASSLYHRAETALRRGDDQAGKRLLDELVRAYPEQPATDSARYELALMAQKAGQSSEALAQTRDILRAGPRGPFVEPAQFLRCRVYLADDRGTAAVCLARFVRDFPGSPHDEAALRTLMNLSQEGGHCDEARRFAEIYLQRHPAGRFAAEAKRARSPCDH